MIAEVWRRYGKNSVYYLYNNGQYDVYREKFFIEYQQDGYCYVLDFQIAEEILKNREIKKQIPSIEEALETEG